MPYGQNAPSCDPFQEIVQTYQNPVVEVVPVLAQIRVADMGPLRVELNMAAER